MAIQKKDSGAGTKKQDSKKKSIDNLAKSLGVSKTLVSLVLNGKGDQYGISKATQERVMQKINEINYRPNPIARGLRTGKSNVIGLVVADISNPFYSKITRIIESYALSKGYHLLVCSTDEIEEKEKDLIHFLIDSQQVSGLIVATTLTKKDIFSDLKNRNYPFVMIDRYISGLEADTVTVDNYNGAFKAVNQMIKTGYKKIAMLTISPSYINSLADREKGYKDALTKNGLKFDKKLFREISFNNIDSEISATVRELLSPPLKAEAIFTANNNLAVHCLDAIRDLGLRIPQDVALVSFDDVDVFRFSSPTITAVAQPVEEIGKQAVELLFKRMNQNDNKKYKVQNIVLPTELIIRKSCGSFIKNSAPSLETV